MKDLEPHKRLTLAAAFVLVQSAGALDDLIVKLLGVSRATIKRSLKQRRETGTVAPKAIPGRPPKKWGALQAELVDQLQAHDDLRLEDHCQLWEQTHGVKVSTTTMSRAIKRLGWTRKKDAGCQ